MNQRAARLGRIGGPLHESIEAALDLPVSPHIPRRRRTNDSRSLLRTGILECIAAGTSRRCGSYSLPPFTGETISWVWSVAPFHGDAIRIVLRVGRVVVSEWMMTKSRVATEREPRPSPLQCNCGAAPAAAFVIDMKSSSNRTEESAPPHPSGPRLAVIDRCHNGICQQEGAPDAAPGAAAGCVLCPLG